MKSLLTYKFKKYFKALPLHVRTQAINTYNIWKENIYHSSIAFKCINIGKSIYSVRIGLNYRALAKKENDIIIWFWIGSHEEYNNLIS